jgi:type I restriction enzyme S subunit
MRHSPHINLPEDHRRLVLGIIAAHLPRGSMAWVFGSRATVGRARPLSDLDLAIDAGRRLALDEVAALVEAFSESDLPYKVDVVDWRGIDERFRQTIMTERAELAPMSDNFAKVSDQNDANNLDTSPSSLRKPE